MRIRTITALLLGVAASHAQNDEDRAAVGPYVNTAIEMFRGGGRLTLPPQALQVAPGQTWSAVGSSFPDINLWRTDIGIKKFTGRFRPAGGVVLAKTVFRNKFGAQDDVRSSSIPGGQTALSVEPGNGWGKGFVGELNFGLSENWEAGFGYRQIWLPLRSRRAVNGAIIHDTDLGDVVMRNPHIRAQWQPSWIGAHGYVGWVLMKTSFDAIAGRPINAGLGLSFVFGR